MAKAGDNLPLTTCGLGPYTDSTVASICCDICLSKKKTNQPAVCYCSTCNKKYCTKHEEFHEETNEDHSTIDFNVYRTQAKKLERRLCATHKDKPYNAGCRVCYNLLCVDCSSGRNSCAGGASHELFSLDQLTALLLEEINKLKSEMLVKESFLEKLFTATSKTISDYEDKTREMLELIRKTRDEHLTCIKSKYTQLEKELLEQREKSKLEIEEFKEEKIGKQWSDVSKRRLRFGAKIDHSHQCDFVSGYEKMVAEAQKIVEEELPSLELENVVSLTDKDECRYIELEMTSEQVRIESEHGLTTSPTPVQSLTLHSQETVPTPLSACHYQGQTYIATEERVVVTFNPTSQSYKQFLYFEDYPTDSVVHKDRVYTLIRKARSCVQVHDLTGRYLMQWPCTDGEGDYSKLVIVNDQVVIPDRTNRSLILYSLSGEQVKQIPLPQLSGGDLALCAGRDNCVVVSNYSWSRVFKVKVTSGEVIWTCTDVINPLGVTCYKQFVLVAGCSSASATINVLDYMTGGWLKVITDNAWSGGSPFSSRVFDLHITDDTLIVPNYRTNNVSYYRINK